MSRQLNELRQKHDFIVESVKLIAFDGTEYDVNYQRNMLKIYEDIFSPFISGELSLTDGTDLPNAFPFIGEEKLIVSFTRPDVNGGSDDVTILPSYQMEFRVYRVAQRESHNLGAQTYTLHLISEEYIKNFEKHVHRAFSGKKYSHMVEKVYNEYLRINKPLVIEATKYQQNFCAGAITPIEFINAIAARSISDEGNGSCYVFFEDRDQFNFISIGKLFLQDPVQRYIYQPSNLLEEAAAIQDDKDIVRDIVSVEKYYHASNNDIIEKMLNGMYGSKLVTVDMLRQKYDEKIFDLNQDFEKFNHLSPAKPFTPAMPALNKPAALLKLVSTDLDQDVQPHLNDPSIRPSHLEEYIQSRTSQLQQINAKKIMINVSGDPRNKAGQIVEFELPQNAGDVSKERPKELDPYLQGKFLVTSIVHTLATNKYSMHMELIKDTFANDIEHVDLVEKYKDIY